MGVFRKFHGDGETTGYQRNVLAMLTLAWLPFDEVASPDQDQSLITGELIYKINNLAVSIQDIDE
jgi:hypothetical protein